MMQDSAPNSSNITIKKSSILYRLAFTYGDSFFHPDRCNFAVNVLKGMVVAFVIIPFFVLSIVSGILHPISAMLNNYPLDHVEHYRELVQVFIVVGIPTSLSIVLVLVLGGLHYLNEKFGIVNSTHSSEPTILSLLWTQIKQKICVPIKFVD